MTAVSEERPIAAVPGKVRPSREAVIAKLISDDRRRRRLAGPRSVGMIVLSIVGVLVVWWLVVVVFQIPRFVLPNPVEVLQQFVGSIPLLAEEAVPTLQEVLIGFAITVAVFVPVGVLIASSRVFEGFVNPLLVISQSTPMIAFAPLLITAFGYSIVPKVVMVVLIAFFPVVVNTVVGIKSVSQDVVDLGRSMGASNAKMLLKVRLPAALPSIFAGLRVAITLSVIGAVVGEYAGADAGLGRLIVVASGRLNTPLVFATVIALAIIGLVLYKLVELAEWASLPWHRDKRGRPGR